MKISVIITLKQDVLDPQGKVINQTLTGMGFDNIDEVRQGKYFEINVNESVMALMMLELVTLSLGNYTAPFQFLIEKLNESNSSLITSIQENTSKIDFENISNPQEIMNSIPEINNFDIDSFFDPVLGPLSFYREVIKLKSKEILNFMDSSVIDLVMDLTFPFENSSIESFEQKLSGYEESSKAFIDFLNNSLNEFTLDEIMSDVNLIPSLEELLDPISWAARTSLPPI